MSYPLEELLILLRTCTVPNCPHGNDKTVSAKDYEDYLSSVDDRLLAIDPSIVLLTQRGSTSKSVDDVLTQLVVICGQHSKVSPWTTNLSIQICLKWYETVCSAFKEVNAPCPLQNGKIVKNVFTLLRPNLLKPTFKCHPADVVCYKWLLQNMEGRLLGDVLPNVFPTALILCDDFESHNITMGLECLHIIIDAVAVEHLKLYSYDDVILDSLTKCNFQGDTEVLSCQLPCYVLLMKKSLQRSKSMERNAFDNVIKTVLFNMYIEQKLDKRQIYASALGDLIDARGLGVVRHLTMIFKIVSEYALEPTTTVETLKALKTILAVCWCRGTSIFDSLMLIVLKLIVEASNAPERYDVDKIVELAAQLVSAAQSTFPEQIDELLREFNKNETLDKKVSGLFTRIFEEPRDT